MARFLHLTDLHVVAEGKTASGVLDTRAILLNTIDQIIEMLSALDPVDAVLVSGDLSDDGTASSYQFVRAQLDRLGVPVLPIPGNHDHREHFRNAFSDLPFMPDCGAINWQTTVNGTLIVGLDTLIEGSGSGEVNKDGLAFLSSAMSQSVKTPTVVLMHHPPFKTGIKFMDAIGLRGIDEFSAVMRDVKHSIIILAGHVHGVHYGQVGGHAAITAPSVCSAFALDRRTDAFIGFFTQPTGFGVLDTEMGYHWSAVPTSYNGGPYAF